MNHLKNSLGIYLQKARETRGLSIDEAAIETNIARKYIEALENDEYSFFPAEMYVTGFLSTYIEILELDKDLVLSMYHRAINKEKEIPLEELYSVHSSNISTKKYVIWIMIAIPIFLGIIIYFISSNRDIAKNEQIDLFGQEKIKTNKEHLLRKKDISIDIDKLDQAMEFEIGISNKIILMNNGIAQKYIQFLGHGRSKKQIKFQLEQDKYIYKNGDILSVDFSEDGINDLSLQIVNVDDKNVKILLSTHKLAIKNKVGFNITPYIKSIQNEVPLMPISELETVFMKIIATRPVWVGYQTDAGEEKEKQLEEGNVLDIHFVDGAKLLLANAGAVTIQIKDMTNSIRGGISGESSQSVFYKKQDGNELKLYRAYLK